MKQRYYNSANINNCNCDYNIILGERSNGKSYAKKRDLIQKAYNDKSGNSKFIYLRRWDLEIKTSLVEQYFADADIKAITNNTSDGILVYQKKIYLAKHDEKDKFVKQILIGYCCALSMEEHYTSGIYTDVTDILFEEFIARQGYLPKEPLLLQQFVSTIARRNRIQVWLIGNTISRLCPYFLEWELVNIPRQDQGTIDIYEHKTDQIDDNDEPIIIKIAVEYAENSGNNGKMFFGSSAKMINSGMWQSEEKPHLEKRIDLYVCMYTIIIDCANFKFTAKFMLDPDTNAPLWYIIPKTTRIKQYDRVITDKLINSMFATRGFIPLNKNESIAFNYLKQGVIYYCDNLTGSDFEACLNQLLTLGN